MGNVTVLLFSRAPTEWVCRREKREVTAMGWFRSRSRLGSYLALFAVAFQLAVSFAHVHLDHVRPAAASAFAEAAASTKQVDAPTAPADHESLADDCCPICALIHLAGTIAPAETPPLPLPGMFFRLRHETAVAFDLTAQPRVLFQARAPPIV